MIEKFPELKIKTIELLANLARKGMYNQYDARGRILCVSMIKIIFRTASRCNLSIGIRSPMVKANALLHCVSGKICTMLSNYWLNTAPKIISCINTL